MKFKRIFALLLATVTLMTALTSCKFLNFKKVENAETEGESQIETEEKIVRTGPCLVVNGKEISEFEILREKEEFDDQYKQIQDAIYSFCNTKPKVEKNSDRRQLIRIVEDFSLSPNEYCIRVVNGELRLGVFSYSFVTGIEQAVELLKSKLVDDAVLEWDNGYIEKGSFKLSVTKYASVPRYENIRLYGGTDQDPLSYADTDSEVRTDDKIVFRLACIAGDKLVSVPWVKYELYNEATGKTETGIVDASSGLVTITVKTSNRGGAVYLDAIVCDASKKEITSKMEYVDHFHFRGSAVVNANKVTMSADVPADFDAFWSNQVSTLYSKPIEILKMVKKSSADPDFKLYYMELRCNVYSGETDGIVSGYLTYPANASSTSQIDLRVGYKGKAFAPSEPIYVANTATFSVCAHSIDCEKANSDPNYLTQQQAKDTMYSDVANSNRDTVYFRGMILRDLQAARFMVEYFGDKGIGDGAGKNLWNGKNFTATGGSQGAFQSIAVAALDKNITYLDISIPWMSDIKCAGNRRKGAFMSYQPALEYYDTTSFAHLVTCKTKVAVSLGDSTCPVSGVLSFYNALTCEKLMICSQNASHGPMLQAGKYRFYE